MNRGLILVTHPSHRAGEWCRARFAVAEMRRADVPSGRGFSFAGKVRQTFTVAKRIAGSPLRGRDSHAFAVATAGSFLPLNVNRDSRVFVDISTKKEVRDAQ